MPKYYSYRFKTKDEFIKEYGNHWRSANEQSSVYFSHAMDYLLGKEYPFNINLDNYNNYLDILPNDNKILIRPGYINIKWVICKYMLTKNSKLEPQYNPKIKIKRIL